MFAYGSLWLSCIMRMLVLTLGAVVVQAEVSVPPVASTDAPATQEMMKTPGVVNAAPQPDKQQKLQALVQLHTADELRSLLQRAEQIANGKDEYNTAEPIALVLHGSEIAIFKRSNYRNNKELVDLAARLDAFNVVDLKVCRRWMGIHNLSESDLPPFLEAVPWGPEEVKRLNAAGYAYF